MKKLNAKVATVVLSWKKMMVVCFKNVAFYSTVVYLITWANAMLKKDQHPIKKGLCGVGQFISVNALCALVLSFVSSIGTKNDDTTTEETKDQDVDD